MGAAALSTPWPAAAPAAVLRPAAAHKKNERRPAAAAFLRSAAVLSTPWPAAAPAAFLRSAAALSTPWPAAVYCWAELFPFHAIPAAIAARKAATPTAVNDEAEAATAEKAATPTAGNDEAEAATAGPPKAAASTSTGILS